LEAIVNSFGGVYLCGINGYNFVDDILIQQMNDAIKHRGPDDSGIFIDNNVTFGHQRLSIIDLSPAGHQPFEYNHKDRKVVIVFNGEIYNFQEIKVELEAKGYKFFSKSDTEVLLASYLEWGYECVNHFNGMWAFVIYDVNNEIFFCSRDRTGKKPLYYYNQKEKFIFSSELKGILASNGDIARENNIDPQALGLYFSLGFIPAPYTIYKNVCKLEARQNLVFNLKDGSIRKWYYYEIPEYKPIYDKRKLIAEGRAILKDAVRLRLISDVPIGAFLSGGLDSSAIVGEMSTFVELKNLHTFSVGFEGKYDETPYINLVKNYFGTIHHHTLFKEKDFEQLIDIYAWIYDEPFGEFSGFPNYDISKIAKQYVTVVLSGDGGDEIFGGYFTHVIGKRMELIQKLPKWMRLAGSKIPVKKNLNNLTSLFMLKKAFKRSLFPSEQFYAMLEEDVLKPEIHQKWTIEKLQYCLKKSGGSFSETLRLYDLLFGTLSDHYSTKVDRASMANAVETRSPFLDYRFIEFAQKIPAGWKVDLFKTKKLMREIIKGIVPEEILRRGKQGFEPPLKEWINNEKYTVRMQKAIEYITKIDTDLAIFLKDRVLEEQNILFTEYRIRLFLFSIWWEKWINK
jgi:asparagine synthase (glutamine-hydrolyzing)